MDLRGRTIAVTGATGFLGRYVTATLLRRGAHVIGVVRNPDRVPELRQRGVELRTADLADRDRLADAFRGTDALVSNAAMLVLRKMFSFGRGNWEEHRRVNVEGTRNVFSAVAVAGVTRVVHVSTVGVYQRARGRISEEAPQLMEPARGHPWDVYSTSKALSEQLAWQLAEQYGLALTTVRPSAIYGAFDANFLPVFRRLVGFPITVLPAFTHIHLVYAGDVAEAIALALEQPLAIGKAYNVTGDDQTVWEFSRVWKQAGGKAARVTIPLPVPIGPMFDNTRAKTDLGWSNRPFAEGIGEMLALESGR